MLKLSNTKYFSERGNPILKLLDRYLGIPLVFFLGLFKKKNNFKDKRIKSIGILCTSGIGDAVIMSGPIKDIKKKYPRSRLYLFTGSSNYEVGILIFGIDKVIRISIINVYQSIKEIRSYNIFDVWIDIGGQARLNAIITNFIKAKYKIGFKTLGQYRDYIYDFPVIHQRGRHEIDNFRNLLKPINIICVENPRLHVNNKESRYNELLNKKYIVFHMFPSGYRSYMKEWPFQYWIKIAKIVLSRGFNVVITGSSKDKNKALSFVEYLDNASIINLCGKSNLYELPNILNNSELVISVNTGIMHIAAAVSSNLIAIHGPTSPTRYGPISINGKSIIIDPEDIQCAPCLYLGSEYKKFGKTCIDNICIKSITPDKVIVAINELL